MVAQERTRAAILEAAHVAFAERGYHRVSLRYISSRVGCTTGAFYSNFATKGDLFLAVLEKHIQEQDDAWDAHIATDQSLDLPDLTSAFLATTPRAQWSAAWMEFIAFASTDPKLSARLEELHKEVLVAWERRLEVLDARFATGHSSLPVSARALLAVAFLNGLAIWGHADKSAPLDERLADGLFLLLGYEPSARGTR